jgi:IS605 OrfB family transposase
MRKTFKYRLYPTKQQRLLDAQLEECRWLYNHLLSQRRDAWEQRQESIRLYDQQATLPALKATPLALAAVHSQVLQNAAVRLDLAFKAFFRRGNFARQHSRRIVNQCDVIAVEDLSVNRMTHNHCLAKSIHDVAWSQFASLLTSKAAWAGRRVVAVNPAYATQECSQCGHRKTDLTLADRTYTCSCCGMVLDRDLNASLNIVRVGQHALASAGKLSDSSGRVVTNIQLGRRGVRTVRSAEAERLSTQAFYHVKGERRFSPS